MKTPRLYIALPVLNEFPQLPGFLQSVENQQLVDFELFVCVNQQDDWWSNAEKREICEDNQKSLDLLRQSQPFPVNVIDRSSSGKGWLAGKGGVGYARKTIMDAIASVANDTDIMVSMDADTVYPDDYLSVIADYFRENPKHLGLSLPYFHRLTGNEETDRLILRYEIYMRFYALNMLRIGNPYRFTALGSAMAFPVWAYRKVGGLTPVQSGEDFYFLQKLVKSGSIGYAAPTVAYPSSRFSDRVNFGTGPALIKGRTGNWDSYPFFPAKLFNKVGKTFDLFPQLFERNLPTPMDEFLKETFKTEQIWEPLRNNYKDRTNFVKACINKVDGLRILQFLKKNNPADGKNLLPLTEFIREYSPFAVEEKELSELNQKGFEQSDMEILTRLREMFFQWESTLRAEKG
jgi:glycosyltransferase involved in cell wall biosynthesis